MKNSNKEKINPTIIMCHSFSKYYSVEVCDSAEYNSSSNGYFHNFFTDDVSHYGFLYTYGGTKSGEITFEL